MGTGAHGVLSQGGLSEATVVAYEARRLTIVASLGYDVFVARFEAAVPVLELARFEALVDSGRGWDDVLAAADENAPHGFMRFWQADVTAMMSPLGLPWRCVEYLMGNQTIAARMYRHDPAVMLYAPLRVTIHTGLDGAACFGIDRPGAQLGSFTDPRIASVGLELDRKVAQLLDAIGVPAPGELTADDLPA
ncbi:DUF302 domain-containing protein [Pseudofrankia inefficax]|uniref:Uncharacterized protein n=1 Tax=Pseudofrankia inefficax (strain DSM 45817 / CECT 9037 / DDB 130130 / EuI1c) TaxID=298654 RepID=E3J407_PSEI1|nr:DUF302 domain-containing protein [Pseudofrankia inefficax]ADP80640.1 protein of unknown function DUF302 [Pseudofrankia inefficax]